MLYIIGEFMLLELNIFPIIYKYLSAIMKVTGMEYQAIDACTNDHIIYCGQYASETNAHNVKLVDIELIK